MKNSVAIVVFISLLMGCGSFNKTKVSNGVKHEYLGVILNENWNDDSIHYYKAYFNDFNIAFDVVDAKYTDNGKMHAARIVVNCRDGYAGSADTSGKSLSRLGFIRDYRKGAEKQFVVGIIR